MFPVKASAIATHLAGWLIFLSLPLFFMTGPSGSENLSNLFLSPYYWLFSLTFLFLFYFNTYLLIPRLYLRQRFILYAGVVLLLMLVVGFLRPFDRLLSQSRSPGPPRFTTGNSRPAPPPGSPADFNGSRPPGNRQGPKADVVSFFLYIVVVSLGLAMQIAQRWRETEKRAVQAEADKANAELSFLKAQINPHFLFNTLNNIYSMAVTLNPNTADSIMKLSNIMRYVTDEVTEDLVPLASEVACIRDYIDLQRLRLNRKTQVDFTV